MNSGDIIDCGDGFWNVRGSYRALGLIEAGTQASLVARESGGFVWLDSLTLEGETLKRIMTLTEGGKAVEAILNLHPFHTLHCEWAARHFPQAKLFGTSRHKARLSDLDWQEEDVDSEAVASMFADLFDFSKPRGVDFISSNDRVHFSSLLARHRRSRTVHSDDTLSYARLPFPISLVRKDTGIFFHPTLSRALEERPGAAADFRDWARQLAEGWADSRRLCAAHNGVQTLGSGEFRTAVLAALERVEPVLAKHERQFA